MSTVLQCAPDKKLQTFSLVELEAKNPDSTRISALDIVGLSWIFKQDD